MTLAEIIELCEKHNVEKFTVTAGRDPYETIIVVKGLVSDIVAFKHEITSRWPVGSIVVVSVVLQGGQS